VLRFSFRNTTSSIEILNTAIFKSALELFVTIIPALAVLTCVSTETNLDDLFGCSKTTHTHAAHLQQATPYSVCSTLDKS
jgi:hypothetical protein